MDKRTDIAGEALTASLPLVVEQIPAMAWACGPEGATLACNTLTGQYCGAPLAPGSDWTSLVHPQEARGARASWRRALHKSTHFRLDCRLRRHDGTYRWHTCHAGAVPGADGRPTHWIAVATDIEGLRRHEPAPADALQDAHSEAFGLLTTLEESAPVALGYVDLKFRIVRANAHFSELTGLAGAQQAGLHLSEALPDVWPQIRESLKHVLDAHTPDLNREVSRTIAPEDSGRDWLFSFFPVLVGKAVIGIGIVAMNITERKLAETALREREQQFRGMVEQSIAGTYILQDQRIAYVNRRFCEIFGYPPEQLIGMDPLLLVAPEERATVQEHMRRRLEGEVHSVSYEFTGVRADATTFEAGVHGSFALHLGRPAIIGLIQDISAKKRVESDRREYVAKLEGALMRSVEVAMTLSEMRDPYTAGHERRVAEIAVAIAREMGLDETVQQGLRIAGYLHDIGKITVPVEILSKSGPLSQAEFALVHGHPQAGYDVLKNVEFPWPIATMILQHHERCDGSGYPRGTSGPELLLESRILSVADVVEAMSSHRPYRAALGVERALAEIGRGRGTLYDPTVCDACLSLFVDKGFISTA